MRKTTIFWLLISSTLAVYNPYENASSPKHYEELFADYRSFVTTLTLANLKRAEKVRSKTVQISCDHENKCGEKRSHTYYCHCDDTCQLARDCCYDYLKICKPNETFAQEERDKWQCVTDLHHLPATSIYFKFLPWYDNQNNSINFPRIRGHIMISSCSNCSQELKKKCSNAEPGDVGGKIPVEGPDGYTYKNRFCALGNGIRPENITSWRYELICPKSLERITSCMNENSSNCFLEEAALLRNSCIWYYAPPLNIAKDQTVCSPVKACPPTPLINMTTLKYSKLRLKCQAYMSIVYHNGSYFKNFHCAECHGIGKLEIQNRPVTVFRPGITLFFKIPKVKQNNQGGSNNGSHVIEEKTTGFQMEAYFNVIGISISMITLLFLIALYLLVQALRTTPGKIIIGLSLSILAYQTVLLLSPRLAGKEVACSVTAIFLHFTILLSFAWMSVMSFDVWKTFGRNKQQSMATTSSTFLYYLLFVIIIPLVIVVTAVLLDRGGVMLVYWRKGPSNACWIVDNLPHILFFKVPVGVSLGLNTIAFIWTIVGITTVRNGMKNSSTRNKDTLTKNLKMYGKLSVVMGLTWILGFTMDYSVILRYLYLIVNSLQGFLIFLAFVTNKRVIEKCRMSRPSWTSQRSWLNTRKTSSGSSKT